MITGQTRPQNTIAEKISSKLGDDGSVWATDEGETLEGMIERAGGRTEMCVALSGDREWAIHAYRLSDGSRIGLVGDNAWDVLDRYPAHLNTRGYPTFDLDSPLAVAR